MAHMGHINVNFDRLYELFLWTKLPFTVKARMTKKWRVFRVNLAGLRGGAEINCVIRRGACESARLIVVRIAVSLRARALEDLRKRRRLAGVR
jgi:hypothetical protein